MLQEGTISTGFSLEIYFFLDQCHVIDSLTDTGCLQLIPFLILVTRASTGYMEMSVSIPFAMCGFSCIIALYSTHQYIVVLEENIHTKNVKIQSQAIVSITISLIPKHQIFRAPCGLVEKQGLDMIIIQVYQHVVPPITLLRKVN